MKEILVLHYAPDAEVVGKLLLRLKAAGLEYEEHAETLVPGVDSEQQIRAWIEHARVVLFCASDAAATRDPQRYPWFRSEWEWSKALTGPPRGRLMLVRAGPLDAANLPGPNPGQLNAFDLHLDGDFEARMSRLIDHVFDALGRERPLAVTGAVVAMTESECHELLTAPRYAEERVQLGRMLERSGGRAEDLAAHLTPRYASTREAFRPFADAAAPVGRSCGASDVLARLQPLVNQRRVRNGDRLLHVHWMTRAIENGLHDRRAWQSGDSIVLVDGASILHEAPRRLLGELPEMDHANQCAWLWLSPFTKDWPALLEQIKHLIAGTRVDQRFDDWTRPDHLVADKMYAFDCALPASLECWLFRALAAARGDEHLPDPSKQERLGGRTDLPAFRGRA